jgi:hypothetical protein
VANTAKVRVRIVGFHPFRRVFIGLLLSFHPKGGISGAKRGKKRFLKNCREEKDRQ